MYPIKRYYGQNQWSWLIQVNKKCQSGCNKLCVDGKVYEDQNSLLQCWRNHFGMLGESADSINGLQNIVDSNLLYESSKANEDSVTSPLKRLTMQWNPCKMVKVVALINVSVEHLKYGGPSTSRWLKQVFNAIVPLEVIPSVLNRSIVVPVYKGKGRDPTNPGSNRGISLTTVIDKCLEKVTLSRLVPVLEDNGCLHPSKNCIHVFQRSVMSRWYFCHKLGSDKVIVWQWLTLHVYLCLFDLEKAFDCVEYNVLLHQLYASGINGKAWRLIKCWYANPVCVVHFNGSVSASFTVSREGVVLSLILFT